MTQSKKSTPGASVDEFFNEQMKNPKFRRAYVQLEPEFALIKQAIERRIKRKQARKSRKPGAVKK
ncbi:MAG: hypothetical protein HY868_12875 [Chloroflexi bacterium]|nr:hypothetical protein [Chloroflexota bacterium]